MPAGFQCFNTDSVIQIDSEFVNYRLSQRGVVAITYANSDNPNNAYVEGVVIPSGAKNPIIAVKSNRNIRTFRETTANGFIFRFRIDDNIQVGTFYADYYVFDQQPTTPSPHGAGMQVYDENGKIVFDSEFGYMSVLGILNQNATFPYTGGGTQTTFTFPSGREVATIICQQALKVLNTDTEVGPGGETVPGFEFYSLTPRCSGNTVTTLDRLCYAAFGSAVAISTRSKSYILVIDVTGL